MAMDNAAEEEDVLVFEEEAVVAVEVEADEGADGLEEVILDITAKRVGLKIPSLMRQSPPLVGARLVREMKNFMLPSSDLNLGGFYCQMHGHGATHDWNHCFQNPDGVNFKGFPNNSTGNKTNGNNSGNNKRGGKSGF